MKCFRNRLLLLSWLTVCAASGASCPRRFQAPATLAPVVFTQPPALDQILAVINANTQRVQRLQATDASISVSGLPSLSTSLALERPLCFRMQAGLALTGTELDLGSNDDVFWMWAKRNDPPALYYARHVDYERGAARQLLPVPPQWLIEALGLIQPDPHAQWDGPYSRGAGRLEIRAQVSTHSGALTKIVVVDDRRGWVLEQHVYDSAGQLLATAMASEHYYDSVHQVTLPRRVDIQLPPAQMAFTLQVDGYLINQLVGDPLQLWSMPQMPGVPLVPLAPAAVSTTQAPVSGRIGWRTGQEFARGL